MYTDDISNENLLSPSGRIRSRRAVDAAVAVLVVFCSAVAVWFYRVGHLPEAGAFYGFSPAALADQTLFSPEFVEKDFPGGEGELLKSLPMLVYPLAAKLGIGGIPLLKLMLAFEIVSIGIGSFIATRILRPGSDLISGSLVAICVFASSFLDLSLARWGHPIYGSVYGYAYGAGLVSIAFLIVGRMKWGALLMALAFMIHPIISLLMLAFAGFAVLSHIGRYNKKALFEAAAIFLAIALAWMVLAMRGAGVASSQVPADLYIGLTRMMNFHWYPLTIGMFGKLFAESLAPGTGFCILLAAYLYGDRDRLAGLERQLAAGFLGMVAITIAGVLIAEYSSVPALIKLALHRASSIFLLMGALVVVPGLWRDITVGNPVRGALALAALIMPFGTAHGIPSLIALAVTAPAIVASFSSSLRSERSIVFGLLLAWYLLVVVWLWSQGLAGRDMLNSYTGLDAISALTILQVGSIVALAAIGIALHQPAAPLVLIGLATLYWSPSIQSFKSQATLKLAQDYLAVQEWARTTTPPGSVFMPDPGHSYGWREASQRPSFGSIREWLQNAFMYNSRKEVFEEGLRRFAEFGLPLEEYLQMDPNVARRRIVQDVRDRYYAAAPEWFERIHARYGIDYFVFEKSRVKNRPPLNVLFENESYLVGQPL